LSKWIEREHDVELWWATTITNEYEIARGDLARDGKPKGYSICPTKSIKAGAKGVLRGVRNGQGAQRLVRPEE
jgi:hypothetical protein